MRWAMRILGGLNILACLLCLYYFFWQIEIHWGKWPGNPSGLEWAVFFVLVAVSTFLVLYLAYLGVRLIRGHYEALRRVCFVCIIDIVLVYGHTLATWNVMENPKPAIRIGLWGIAISPLEPEVLFGYVFVALASALILILIGRKTHGVPATQVG
jgi:hypothetical protein